MTDENASTPTESLARVAAKLPGFWTNDPPLWFGHSETTFRQLQHHGLALQVRSGGLEATTGGSVHCQRLSSWIRK